MVHRMLEGQRCWAESLGTEQASTTGGRHDRKHMASLQAGTLSPRKS